MNEENKKEMLEEAKRRVLWACKGKKVSKLQLRQKLNKELKSLMEE